MDNMMNKQQHILNAAKICCWVLYKKYKADISYTEDVSKDCTKEKECFKLLQIMFRIGKWSCEM